MMRGCGTNSRRLLTIDYDFPCGLNAMVGMEVKQAKTRSRFRDRRGDWWDSPVLLAGFGAIFPWIAG
jgi:hypothetical protein